MEKRPSSKELEELEEQLSCPNGEKGVETAAVMHSTNIGMTLNTIQALNLQDYNSVLELGHGNCAHLPHIFSRAENIRFYGLEISQTMVHDASRINKEYVDRGRAAFRLYDGKTIPFTDNFFDRILTINTLYFWNDPHVFLKELYRVLKEGGELAVTYAQKQFMKQLPFVGQRFRLYDNNDFDALVRGSGLIVSRYLDQKEQTKSKNGDAVERHFTVATLTKSLK